MEGIKMEQYPSESEEGDSQEESAEHGMSLPESEVHHLSPEEQERTLDEYALPQLEGLKSILADKQFELTAGAEPESEEALRQEIVELEQMIADLSEFIDDVVPEPEAQESDQESDAERRERMDPAEPEVGGSESPSA